MAEVKIARALYDFNTTEADEISLKTGDIVSIVKQVDSNWLKGKIGGKIGNFPSSFVVDIPLPPIAPGQKVFLASRSFPAEVDGDLGFQKGEDLIIVTTWPLPAWIVLLHQCSQTVKYFHGCI